MRLLLDTHTFLWFVEGNPQLSARARALIEDSFNEVLLSVASIWEIAIKYSLGKLSLTAPIEVFFAQQLQANAITTLDVRTEHVIVVAALPFHHRDPFDRLLIVQAQVEGVPIISADTAFDPYPIQRIW